MLTMCIAIPLFAEETNPPQEVPISSTPPPEGVFRSPVSIQCYYSNGELTFTFSANLGIVECEVVRVSDETVYEATFYATKAVPTVSMSPPMLMIMRSPSRARMVLYTMENIP